MKRLPIFLSLCALIALSASLAYWLLQLYQPVQRPLAALPETTLAEPGVDAAATLFGGQASSVLASNYQLTGVIVAGRDSVAILVADGSPPKALKLGKEIVSGVTLREIHPRYVMLADGGVLKRIELASNGKASGAGAGLQLGAQAQSEQPQFQQPSQPQPQIQNQPQQAQDGAQTQMPPIPVPADAPASAAAALPAGPPPRPPVQMPAPTRGINTGEQQQPAR